jgi:hypothetical protein
MITNLRKVTIMTPLKIFLKLKAWLETAEATAQTEAYDDPLRHPDINGMDLQQLADLPFPGVYRAEPATESPKLAKCA